MFVGNDRVFSQHLSRSRLKG